MELTDETLIEDLEVGNQFYLAGSAYIKTNMIHKETGNIYCCHETSGVMYIFPGNTEVEKLCN